jgi:hypothetical protein
MSGIVSPFKGSELPANAVGLRLCKIFPGDDLRLCETVRFARGRPAVDTILRRAAVSGRVEIGGKLEDHWADIITPDGSWEEVVALDASSFKALKEHWMRCRYERSEQ